MPSFPCKLSKSCDIPPPTPLLVIYHYPNPSLLRRGQREVYDLSDIVVKGKAEPVMVRIHENMKRELQFAE